MQSQSQARVAIMDASDHPVIFLGPSMAPADAAEILEADYRPPIRRGDLDNVPNGKIVAIIDGVFEQDLAVSPAEIRTALDRGVTIVGGSSMGALRAAEISDMIGIGRIWDWYRTGLIERDDEVALIFDPIRNQPLSVPLVNVRFAVERLASLGTINDRTAAQILDAARKLSFKDRCYPQILDAASIGLHTDSGDLAEMLETYDLKRQDAQAVLEYVEAMPRVNAAAENLTETSRNQPVLADSAIDRLLIWESGDSPTFGKLLEFLLLSGGLIGVSRDLSFAGYAPADVATTDHQSVFVEAVRRWGWNSSEETQISLADLGVDQSVLSEACTYEACRRHVSNTLLQALDEQKFPEIVSRLFLDELALKRAVMQLGSLEYFAARSGDIEPTREEREDARRTWSRLNGVARPHELTKCWRQRGVDQETADAAINWLARARRAALPLAKTMRTSAALNDCADPPQNTSYTLERCFKPKGEPRFAWTIDRAEQAAQELARRIGVTRIGMIGELGEFVEGSGVYIAQAARPGGAWSSSYGSGKSRSRAGAIVGSVVEELEKWAQEKFAPADEEIIFESFNELKTKRPCVDPATLDLPFDTSYRPHQPIAWYPSNDLLSGETVLTPLDTLRVERGKRDICYTNRGARKHLATNGLGAGFSREEATLHAVCEVVERHAQRLAELFLSNPGGIGAHPYRFVDPRAFGTRIDELAEGIGSAVDTVRLLDITSDVEIPTFMATLTRDYQRAEGFGTHPNPAVAAEMALLEAAQTISSAVAGGREDLSINARSLGRHERPRPVGAQDSWFWMDPDTPLSDSPSFDGFVTDDVFEDVQWALGRVRAAGLDHLLAIDISPPEADPACVVRVQIPGLESNNAFYTGPRARLVLARPFLPRWV